MGYEINTRKIRPEEVVEMLRLASLGVRPENMVARLKRSKSAIRRHLRECGFPSSEIGRPIQMPDGRFKHSRTGVVIDPYDSLHDPAYDVSGRPEQAKTVDVEVNGEKATLVRVPDKRQPAPSALSGTDRAPTPVEMPEIYRMLEHAIQENIKLKNQITELSATITELRAENETWISDIERLETEKKNQTKHAEGLSKVVDRFRAQFGNVRLKDHAKGE